MKTFLRQMTTGRYFQSPAKWTFDREQAHDFRIISNALKTAHKLRIRDLELELSFQGSEQPPSTPFQQFILGRSHPRNQRTAPGNRLARAH